MKYSIVVIGAGSGGLVIAIGAAKAGKKVLLIEKGLFGGDCTNYGCIPSKTLIGCAEKGMDGKEALKKVREIVNEVRSHEDADALKKMGVDTLIGEASFESPHVLTVLGQRIEAKNIVIAAGSSPAIPDGLEGLPYLTNETVFDLEEPPKHLAILGAGPIGSELAMAFKRLGSKVTMIRSPRGILPNEDSDVQKVMEEVFKKEEIEVVERSEKPNVIHQNGSFEIGVKEGKISADQFLVAIGRRPNCKGLNLEKAKIAFSEKGIQVDKYGRTSQSHIYAIGDIAGAPFFTHKAENQARSVLTSLLLPFKKKLSSQPIPKATFTDPEVASVGLTDLEAQKKYKSVATYFVSMKNVDRAITQERTEGFVKIVTKKWSSKILGATIVAPNAGEMLQEITTAIFFNIPLRKLANLIHPYPVYSQSIRKAADLWLTQTILGIFRRKK